MKKKTTIDDRIARHEAALAKLKLSQQIKQLREKQKALKSK